MAWEQRGDTPKKLKKRASRRAFNAGSTERLKAVWREVDRYLKTREGSHA